MVRINLLPVRVSKKKEAGKQQLVLLAVVLALGVIVNGVIHQSRASVLTQAESDLGRKKAEIQKLDAIIGEVREITTQQEQLKKKLDTLDKLKQARSGPVRMLDELSSLTPRRLWLRKMEEKAGKMTIEGTAISIDDVSQFIGALKTSKYLGDPELKKAESGKGGDAKKTDAVHVVDFTILATAKYAPKPAEPEPTKKPGAAKGKG